MSMMFITHDLGVIGDIADDVVVMYRSNVVEKNNANSIFTEAHHPYTKGLLACRPKLGANPRRLLTVSDFMTEQKNYVGKNHPASGGARLWQYHL